ncbi:MAG TPA: SDR family NAD(P)-dependent oxidoreductase [Amycolatopsis sp.]|nr:SDR family NAD(P)-dependent oxidoreductase [Amycolatopsis sp.]
MTTLAIFGAGPGLGLSTARRFGKQGYEVALVARREDRLRSFVNELTDDGIAARFVAADVSDRAGHQRLVERLGPVDAAVINGFADPEAIRPVRDIDVESMSTVLDGAVLGPLSLTRLLLPGMLARGDGAIVYGFGGSARVPLPPLAGAGAAQAALRNYALALNLDLAASGVYIGALTIGALIERSDAERTFDTDALARRGFEPERVDPDTLADLVWTMCTERDTAERTVGALAA